MSSTISSGRLIWSCNSLTTLSRSNNLSLPIRIRLQSHGCASSFPHLTERKSTRSRQIRSVEEETLILNEENRNEEASVDTPVSVPVSPSDTLTMFFQAEGTMNETVIPAVTKALEETEGITNLRVQVLEGIASVETTVQATGVASSLVEIIQGSGFKLQTLNLSFEDEEDTST